MNPLNDFELKLVQKALQIGYSIEERLEKTSDSNDSELEKLFSDYVATIGLLSTSEHFWLRKCSSLIDMIHPRMNRRDFLNTLVPLERILDRTKPESEFMVTSEDQSVSPKPNQNKKPLIIVLDNIRSAFNVGSIFRLADGLGLKALYLSGYTATPDSALLRKTALGAEQSVPWKQFDHLQSALDELKKENCRLLGLETAKNAKSLYEIRFFDSQNKFPSHGSALLVGNERFGIDLSSLKQCDDVVSIPMDGVKNSLNVVSALSIVSFEWTRQFQQLSPLSPHA